MRTTAGELNREKWAGLHETEALERSREPLLCELLWTLRMVIGGLDFRFQHNIIVTFQNDKSIWWEPSCGFLSSHGPRLNFLQNRRYRNRKFGCRRAFQPITVWFLQLRLAAVSKRLHRPGGLIWLPLRPSSGAFKRRTRVPRWRNAQTWTLQVIPEAFKEQNESQQTENETVEASPRKPKHDLWHVC